MASNSTLPTLPNPYTPLAFLPPTLADQFQASGYLYVAGLSAYLWDWFMSMPDEYKFIRKSKFSVPNAAYFLSRFGTVAYCVTGTIFQVGTVDQCNRFIMMIGWFFVVAMPSTSLLFLFRVRAVYGNSKIIVYFFGILWLAILGLCAAIPFGIKGAHIGPTQRCINTEVASYISAPIALNAINDTLIFLAISFRIISFSVAGETGRDKLRSFISGDGLPQLSKGLLQGGQLYYFVTIGLSIVTTVMVLSPSVPPVFHAMFSVPNIALESAMACRVFRAVKLGFIKDTHLTTNGSTLRSTRLQFDNGDSIALKQSTPDSSQNVHVNVDITKTTDFAEYPHVAYDFDKPAVLVKEVDPSKHV